MNETILVVDDEREIADLLEIYLKNDGYTVHTCATGAEALRCVESEHIDLALLDVMLPDIDGFSLCRKIRRNIQPPDRHGSIINDRCLYHQWCATDHLHINGDDCLEDTEDGL